MIYFKLIIIANEIYDQGYNLAQWGIVWPKAIPTSGYSLVKPV